MSIRPSSPNSLHVPFFTTPSNLGGIAYIFIQGTEKLRFRRSGGLGKTRGLAKFRSQELPLAHLILFPA